MFRSPYDRLKLRVKAVMAFLELLRIMEEDIEDRLEIAINVPGTGYGTFNVVRLD